MNKVTLASTAAITLLVAGLSVSAIADSKDTTAAQQNAAISLTQAVSIAEKATGGKKTDVEFELEDGVAIYEVEIDLPDGSEIELDIDANSGVILSQETDDEEHRSHHQPDKHPSHNQGALS